MNKVDLAVKKLLLTFPTLYRNRFEALGSIFTASDYEWDESGNVVELFDNDREATVEAMLKQFQEKLEATKLNYGDGSVGLYRRFILEDEQALLNAKFIASNIDTFASEWVNVDYVVTWHWLWDTHRRGISKYWLINQKPEVVDVEWGNAIRDWLGQLMSPANQLFGTYTGGSSWVAIPAYASVFNWIHDTYKLYETAESIAQRDGQDLLAKEIMDEILGEVNKDFLIGE